MLIYKQNCVRILHTHTHTDVTAFKNECALCIHVAQLCMVSMLPLQQTSSPYKRGWR